MEESQDIDLVVAVAGSPNVGKSTLLNRLVGALSHVGNWPGKTVDIIAGVIEYKGYRIQIVDLPGTYGLSGVTEEEDITRKYLLGEYGERVHKHRRAICESCPFHRTCFFSQLCLVRLFSDFLHRRKKIYQRIYTPDVVLIIVDATVLEKTLYLAISILELTPNAVIALNKIDELEERGMSIDTQALSKRLGVPVIPISALKGKNIDKLLDAILSVWRRRISARRTLRINYGILEHYIQRIESLVRKAKLPPNYPRRWVAIRLLEGDHELFSKIKSLYDGVSSEIETVVSEVRKELGDDVSAVIARIRYNYIAEITRDIIKKKVERVPELSLIDRVFTHPLIGPIASILLLFVIFLAVFSINLGFPLNIALESLGMSSLAELLEEYSLVSLVDYLVSLGIDYIRALIEPYSVTLASFIADGVLGGFGLIMTFFPLIILVLFLISLLEDSGLAARITVAIDSLFSKFGLTGRAVFPLMLSMGCNVPGIMSTRTVMGKGERLGLILASPFIICQARLIVLIAIITVAFTSPIQQTIAFLSIFLISILLYLIMATIFARIFREEGEVRALVMDIPPVRRPSIRVAWWNAWIMGKEFIKKAGTIIVMLSMLVWFLLSYGPNGYTVDPDETYGAIIGKTLAPIAHLWGISDVNVAWKIVFALIYGFIAKEGLLVAIAQLSSKGVSFEEAWLSFGLTPIQSFAILLFFMTYVPCMATVITIRYETKSWRLTLLSIVILLITATILSTITYHILAIIF